MCRAVPCRAVESLYIVDVCETRSLAVCTQKPVDAWLRHFFEIMYAIVQRARQMIGDRAFSVAAAAKNRLPIHLKGSSTASFERQLIAVYFLFRVANNQERLFNDCAMRSRSHCSLLLILLLKPRDASDRRLHIK